jgi:hypothetical protein
LKNTLDRRRFIRSLSRTALVLPFADILALAAPPQQQAPGKLGPQERSYDAKPAPPPPGPKSPIEGTPLGLSFIDVAAQAGLTLETTYGGKLTNKYLLETTGCGLAFYDYDNDGWQDLFLVNGWRLEGFAAGQEPRCHLFKNNRDGTFTDVTKGTGLEHKTGWGQACCVGDYNNDGNDDLFVTYYGQNALYRNNGNGTFTDVTEQSGAGGSGWSTSAAWVDLDNDGRLDLIVLRYMQWDFDDIYCGEHTEGGRAYCHPDTFKPIAPLVFHNDGNGHFSEVAEKLHLQKPGKGLGIAVADYDRDGRIDFFIANDSMPEFLYRNKGDGTFEECGLLAQVAVDEDGKTFAGMGVDFNDFNNDGFPDLIVDDLSNETYALFENNKDATFNYTTGTSGLGRMTQPYSGWGVKLFDYDNDGWKDLMVAQGHDLDTIEKTNPHLHYRQPPLLARNTGHGFVQVPGLDQAWVARGLAIGDLDNDGLVDVVVTTNDGPAYVLRNTTPGSGHWLTLNLIGHKSNRDGIGAAVKVVSKSVTQFTTVSTAGSYLSSSDKRAHFGLGADTLADRIEIQWPSGIKQVLTGVKANQVLNVEESDAGSPASATQAPR